MEITSWIQTGALAVITTLAGWYKSAHDKEHDQIKRDVDEKQDLNVCDSKHESIINSINQNNFHFTEVVNEMKENQKDFIKKIETDQKETRQKFEEGTKVMTELATLVKNNGGIL